MRTSLIVIRNQNQMEGQIQMQILQTQSLIPQQMSQILKLTLVPIPLTLSCRQIQGPTLNLIPGQIPRKCHLLSAWRGTIQHFQQW